MNAEATRHRIPAVFIWGAFVVLAWAAFTALVGGGDARADDEDPKPLSGLTSLVNGVVTEVVDPVVETAATVVTEVTNPVVDVAKNVVTKTAATVSSVPVVGTPASDALGAAGQAVTTVTDSVTDVVSDSPVSAIVHPVTDVVRDVPVVGGVLDELGATDLLDESAGAVDGVVGALTPIVDDTVPPVVDSLQPQLPGDGPSVTPGDGEQSGSVGEDLPVTVILPGASVLPVVGATASDGDVDSSGWDSVGSSGWASAGSAPPPAHATASESGGADSPPAGGPVSAPAMAPASSSAGPSGSSGGMNAVLHHLPIHADGAWSGAGLPADSTLPPSPAGSTDVSPD